MTDAHPEPHTPRGDFDIHTGDVLGHQDEDASGDEHDTAGTAGTDDTDTEQEQS